MLRKIVAAASPIVLTLLASSASAAPVPTATTSAANVPTPNTKAALPAVFDLKPFFPTAEHVAIQMLSVPDAQGNNVRVTASLDPEGLKELAQATGQTTFARITAGRFSHFLRDDGQGGDARARDREFTFDIALPLAEIFARAELELKLERGGRLGRLPVFEGRELVGHEVRRRFDFDRFRRGIKVALEPLSVGTVFNPAFDEEFFDLVIYTLFPADIDHYTNPAINDPTRTWNPCTQQGNPDGPWTFKHIMTGLAGGQDPSAFVEHWITLYTEDQTSSLTNGFTVQDVGFGADQLIDQWRDDSGGGALDLEKAPFRLMAIVPRIDLRSGGIGPYGSGDSDDAGELRFIFGAVRQPMTTCQPMDFSVIVELGVPKTECEDVRQWARDWIELTEIALESSEDDYLAALEALTTEITSVGAEPGNPNGSTLNQLRSNEESLGSSCCWRIREFHLAGSGQIEQATTAATPDRLFKGVTPWYQYFDELIQTPTLPAPPLTMSHPSLPDTAFLGAEAIIPFPAQVASAWGSISDLDFSADPTLSAQRHRRGLATCDGCHGPETQTPNAHMVHPVTGATSPFLFGGGFFDPDVPHTVTDPVDGVTEHSFFDLLHRAGDIHSAANSLCGLGVAVDMMATGPVAETH